MHHTQLSHVTDRLTDGQTPQTSVTIVCISCIRCSLFVIIWLSLDSIGINLFCSSQVIGWKIAPETTALHVAAFTHTQ